MTTLSKNDTGLGQDISRETRRSARSAALFAAAESRRAKRIRDAEAVCRCLFPVVTNGRGLSKWFTPTWAVREAGRDRTGAPESDPVDEAIKIIVDVCGSTYQGDTLGLPEDEAPGFAGEDIVVWLDGKVRAVIRRGADGKPEVTRFDSPERRDDERGEL